MKKIIHHLAMPNLVLAFVFCTLGAIASLDELVRLPFYYATPVAAVLINGVWLFIVWRKRGRIKIPAAAVFSRLASVYQSSHRSSAFSFNNTGRQARTRLINRQARKGNRQQPSSEQVQAALKKVHSVAWGFPIKSKASSNQLGGVN